MNYKTHLNFRHLEGEMGVHSYKKRRNASVIAFSPTFIEAVNAVRSALGIPIEGFRGGEEASEWYSSHLQTSTREHLKPMPRYYWHFPKEFIEVLESLSYPREPSRVNFYQDVPLDQFAMDLIHRFNLPEELVDEVKANILLRHHGSLGIGPTLQLILVPVNEGEEGIKYMALVAGIDAATTQKNWLEVWESVKAILRLSGIGSMPYRRPIDKLLLRDLTFWKEIRGGKTARETVDKWIEKHPEDCEFDEDIVRKAVQRMDKIMRSEQAKGRRKR